MSQLCVTFNVNKGQIWASGAEKCSWKSSLLQHVLLAQTGVQAGAAACPAEQVCFQGGWMGPAGKTHMGLLPSLLLFA